MELREENPHIIQVREARGEAGVGYEYESRLVICVPADIGKKWLGEDMKVGFAINEKGQLVITPKES